MARRYENGVIVGEVDPPIPFEEWLRRQIEQAESLKPSQFEELGVSGAYINGRRQALKEAEIAWKRRAV